MMSLSERLKRLADMVTEGGCLADVGTDHGYVPIYLMEKGRISHGIAMDINQGPLLRAKEHIARYGYEAYIETRLSDGVRALKRGEADSVLIAGMGGGLVMKILAEGTEVLPFVKELILQPQSELGRVRRFLHDNGYRILEEDMVLEEGKFYSMMKTAPGRTESYAPWEEQYGKLELQRSPEILEQLVRKSLEVKERICAQLPGNGSGRVMQRRTELETEIAMLLQVREALQTGGHHKEQKKEAQSKKNETTGGDCQ